jgi:hypothetical protein
LITVTAWTLLAFIAWRQRLFLAPLRMPPLALNVGFQGESRSNADITEPSLLTRFGSQPRRALPLAAITIRAVELLARYPQDREDLALSVEAR